MKANPHQAATLALLWLAGLYLRLPILVAPPLAPQIAAELALNQSQIGSLTTLPVLMLALGALPGAYVIARLGARAAVAVSLVVLAAASTARGLAPPVLVLFGSTMVMGLAIAVMQPALPALVQRWCPAHAALASAVFMNGLLMGEFLGAGLTLPVLMPLLEQSWRATLAVWSLPALAVAAAVAVHRRAEESTVPAPEAAWRAPWRDPRMWKLALLLGSASAGFFGTNAYMGSVLAEAGRLSALPGMLLAFNATQVLGSFLMIALARVLVGRRWPVVAVAAGLCLGLAGFAFGDAGTLLAAVLLLGLCTCVQLVLMVSLVPLLAGSGAAGPLAAGMFAVGYLLGFLVPLVGGVLADAWGSARLALLPLGVLAATALAVALAPGLLHGSASTNAKGEGYVR